MNLRENIKAERVSRINPLASARRPVDRAPGAWLACYPIFQDALRSGETTFLALPDYAKSVALRRATIDMAERAIASATLDEVHVSFVELCMHSVSEVVEDYLGSTNNGANALLVGSAMSPQGSAEQFAPTGYPLIARPPCLLRPGHHVFLDGWMRFFSYRSCGDRTIPLLAIDWLDFHDRLRELDVSKELRAPPAKSIYLLHQTDASTWRSI
ncbi:hypothetical protein [Caballeronia sp. SBC2]|uniref:hypothetical protein n=1 Tax=Caballeronia sp. SBC2 TaxID=2705547 RepID=UPI0013E14E99|nr:hypothetical protein [Caballeronia sp. SBC2]QIE29783.1 hypothetical protein SBC2_78590 [Caballeronia sp. SBC2]